MLNSNLAMTNLVIICCVDLIDVDECSLSGTLCHPNSVCINTFGTYFCTCKVGFHSDQLDNLNGALCKDLDECRGWGLGHGCSNVTVCNNLEGSYECVCGNPEACSESRLQLFIFCDALDNMFGHSCHILIIVIITGLGD